MQNHVRKLDEAQVRRDYPISDRLPGWFFRITEQSSSVYKVEGTDLWGRRVSETGTDETGLLSICTDAARRIDAQVRFG